MRCSLQGDKGQASEGDLRRDLEPKGHVRHDCEQRAGTEPPAHPNPRHSNQDGRLPYQVQEQCRDREAQGRAEHTGAVERSARGKGYRVTLCSA